VQSGEQQAGQAVQGPPFEALVQSLRRPPLERDDTLQDPRTVFQLLKRHYSRYTPEMVAQVTGCPQDIFLQAADTILANSGRDRTTA
jgi:formate dehydrogenase major subunit